MSGRLAAALAAERRAFDEAHRTVRLGLVSFVMSDSGATGTDWLVPTLSVPADYAALLLTRNFDEEVLAGAAAASVETLRAAGPTVLLGASLFVLADLLRMRVAPEEQLAMAVEAARCFETPDTMRLHGRCLSSIGTILRDAGTPYDAMAAYAKAAVVLSRYDDVSGLTEIAYHRTAIARSAQLYEEGLLHTEPFTDRPDAEHTNLFEGILSERAYCRFESGDVVGAGADVDAWIARSADGENMLAFNKVLPYSMRARLRMRNKDLDGATDDTTAAAELAVLALRERASRTFRSSDRAQLDSVFERLLELAIVQDRADLAFGALLAGKTVSPGLYRPAQPRGEDETFVASVAADLAADAAALSVSATTATIFRDGGAMRDLSDRSLELIDGPTSWLVSRPERPLSWTSEARPPACRNGYGTTS